MKIQSQEYQVFGIDIAGNHFWEKTDSNWKSGLRVQRLKQGGNSARNIVQFICIHLD